MDDDLTRLGLMDEEEIALDAAALALAMPDHPGLDPVPYQALTGVLAERLAVVGADARTASAQAAALAQVMAAEAGFLGDRDSYDDPANADLVRVIDRRRGLPVSLSILYAAVARRVGWTADLLDVPGHVLLLVGGTMAPVVVDPFRGGVEVEPARLMVLLARAPGEEPATRQVAVMPARGVLVRLLLNQASRAERAGKGRRALELYRRMTAVAPDHGAGWWERARLELVDGDVAAARRSLADLLEVTREPDLRARVAELLVDLPAE